MQELILHVGHAKTGTSFLQSFFAMNRQYLRSLGVYYPTHASDKKSKLGKTSSGNGLLALQRTSFVTDADKILLSSEALYSKILLDLQLLIELNEKYKIQVVIYTRDLVEFLVSSWSQNIKRQGATEDLESYIKNKGNRVYANVVKWLELSEQLNFDCIVRNYSRCKNSLVEDFFQHSIGVNLPNDIVENHRGHKVNRSLTKSETDIQRVFNAAFGEQSSRYIADILVDDFPNTKPSEFKLSIDTYKEVVDRYSKIVDLLNQKIDSDQAVQIGSIEDWVGVAADTSFLDEHACLALGEAIRQNLKQVRTEEIVLLQQNTNNRAGALVNFISRLLAPGVNFFKKKNKVVTKPNADI